MIGLNKIFKIEEWFHTNRLTINASKTKYILYTPKYITPITRNLIFSGIIIDQIGINSIEKAFKFLGLNVDQKLNWEHHCSMTSAKINSSIYVLNHTKNWLLENICPIH